MTYALDKETVDRIAAMPVVIEAAKAQGKPTGIITGDMKLIHHCEDLGMQIFSCNSEVGLLAKQLKAMVAEFNG